MNRYRFVNDKLQTFESSGKTAWKHVFFSSNIWSISKSHIRNAKENTFKLLCNLSDRGLEHEKSHYISFEETKIMI